MIHVAPAAAPGAPPSAPGAPPSAPGAPPSAPAAAPPAPAESRGCLYALSQPPLMLFLTVIGALLLFGAVYDLYLW